MVDLAVSPDAPGNASRAGGSMASSPGRDADLCDQIKAYLEYRSRKIDAPTALADAWDHFYDSYTPQIRRFLRRSGLPEPDQEDCLQIVWSEVVCHLPHFRYEAAHGRLTTWLLTVARNRAVDAIRRRRRRSAELLENATALVDPGLGPAAACERFWARDRVRRVLTELSTQVSTLNFQVLYQRGIDGRTGAEVGESLGLTAEQVRFRFHRMKRKFRDLFDCDAGFAHRSSAGQTHPDGSFNAGEKAR